MQCSTKTAFRYFSALCCAWKQTASKFGTSATAASRVAVWKSPSAFSTDSSVSARIKRDAFAHDVVHEPIVHPHPLLYLLGRAYEKVEWESGCDPLPNLDGLVMHAFSVTSHDYQKIDIRIRCGFFARMRTEQNNFVRMKLARDLVRQRLNFTQGRHMALRFYRNLPPALA